jgi:hypothetical protein
MAGYKRPIGEFIRRSKGQWKKLLPDVFAKNPYLGWSLFGTAALSPIVGYEIERRVRPPEPEDEPDIDEAKKVVAEALNKRSDLSSVLATEVAEQTLLRGLNDMQRSVHRAKHGGLPGLPALPAPAKSFTTRSQEESREEGDTLPESDRPAASRKRMV